MKNYYEILEVNKNASPEVIEKAYKALTKKYHPDVQPADKKYFSELKMKEITEAYEVLSNKEKKENYDSMLNSSNDYNSEIYNNLYSERQKLEDEVKKLRKEKNMQQDIINKIPTSTGLDFKYYFKIIGTALYNSTKKEKSERKKDIIALLLTILIISTLVFFLFKFNIF